MSDYKGVYSVLLQNSSVSGAITLCQVNAPTGNSVEILRAWITFNSTASTAIRVGIKEVSTAGTGGAFTAEPIRGDAAFGGTCSINHSAEGTLVDEYLEEYVNYLNGFLYLPIPEERLKVVGGGRLALYLPAAPGAALNIVAGMIFGVL